MEQERRTGIRAPLSNGAQQIADFVSTSTNVLAGQVIEVLMRQLDDALKSTARPESSLMEHLSGILMNVESDEHPAERARLLIETGLYFERIGRSVEGIARAEAARNLAIRFAGKNLERRACNVLSALYVATSQFEFACARVERAVQLAREMEDAFLERAALSNAVVALKKMGLYRDALDIAEVILAHEPKTPQDLHIRFLVAGNGLFCADRLKEEASAFRCMAEASKLLEIPLVDAVAAATFEFFRAAHLVALRDHETAELLISAAVARLQPSSNPRVVIQLGIAQALCDWGSREAPRIVKARQDLRALHGLSKEQNLYHDDVLRALVLVHSWEYGNREIADAGLAYARELVEYVGSVRRAHFHRQLVQANAPQIRSVGQIAAESKKFAQTGHSGVDELAAANRDLDMLRSASLETGLRTPAYETAENWAIVAEFAEDHTGQHCFRVGRLAGMIAAQAGMDEIYCTRLEMAARLHDLGKTAVSETILLKPGPLDPGEAMSMRAHTEVGAFMLQGSGEPTLEMASQIARHHHEWWNGAGYPAGLQRGDIPLAARICAFADAYDALTHARVYRKAWSHDDAVEEIMGSVGTHFDPVLANPFLRALEYYLPTLVVTRPVDAEIIARSPMLTSRRKLMEAVAACS